MDYSNRFTSRPVVEHDGFFLRALTLAESTEVYKRAYDDKGEPIGDWQAELIAATLCDEHGERAYSPSLVDCIRGASREITSPLFLRVQSLNGLAAKN